MRDHLNQMDMDATIVIGEGEMDEAPMLHIGERLGKGNGPKLDIAVDPIEGTTLMSKGQEQALAVIAVATSGCLLHAPDMYMEKIAVGPRAKGSIHIERPLLENMKSVAKRLNKDIRELTVMIQDRPRHQHLIQQVLDSKARLKLFQDVDIAGAIATSLDEYDIDMLVGMGGAPEGVITATAIKSLGGDFQAKLAPQTLDEYERCKKMGIQDPEKVLSIDEIVKTNDCFFVATGITDGLLLRGIQCTNKHSFVTESLVVTGKNKDYHFIKTHHNEGEL